MKRDSKTIIPYEDIDCELVELIKCINEVDGIETTQCCCGHGTMPCQIWFEADSIEDVTHFIHNYLYGNPLWRIVINLTDNEIYDNEWDSPSYLLETTCSDYYYTGVSIDNLKYRMQQKQREMSELILCKDCKYFEYDSVAQVEGIPLIVAHEICKKWGEGCKTNENGYCFLAELKGESK